MLSYIHLNLYFEQILSNAFDEVQQGVRVNREYMNNLRYADKNDRIAGILKLITNQ